MNDAFRDVLVGNRNSNFRAYVLKDCDFLHSNVFPYFITFLETKLFIIKNVR